MAVYPIQLSPNSCKVWFPTTTFLGSISIANGHCMSSTSSHLYNVASNCRVCPSHRHAPRMGAVEPAHHTRRLHTCSLRPLPNRNILDGHMGRYPDDPYVPSTGLFDTLLDGLTNILLSSAVRIRHASPRLCHQEADHHRGSLAAWGESKPNV